MDESILIPIGEPSLFLTEKSYHLQTSSFKEELRPVISHLRLKPIARAKRCTMTSLITSDPTPPLFSDDVGSSFRTFHIEQRRQRDITSLNTTERKRQRIANVGDSGYSHRLGGNLATEPLFSAIFMPPSPSIQAGTRTTCVCMDNVEVRLSKGPKYRDTTSSVTVARAVGCLPSYSWLPRG